MYGRKHIFSLHFFYISWYAQSLLSYQAFFKIGMVKNNTTGVIGGLIFLTVAFFKLKKKWLVCILPISEYF